MQGLGRDTQNRDSPKREKDLRGSAILHQQRRLKQATQFVHKDSADLLPLDQLRRLGTSKDLQPHSVIQRRLMGGSLSIESDNPVFPTSPCNRGRDAPPRVMRRYSQLSWVRRPPVAGRNKLYSYPARFVATMQGPSYARNINRTSSPGAARKGWGPQFHITKLHQDFMDLGMIRTGAWNLLSIPT
ncbi:uncharacterized protein LOC101731235 isoform X2 [Xenopus tropicalis]|uniref:Uncharacterized protein LOC101731235 isoform X2 n=1 Tax=Xenopus tropicalis TaxID=8364 RepID=A0A8J1IR75_XENTR|nr:uncharacterized protein LOC116406974 isoform X2 [Xenopus tropicalis]XP_031748097.1 uncharacterized protein LOC101731235 isoform X2 [Xenopus tropicalis]